MPRMPRRIPRYRRPALPRPAELLQPMRAHGFFPGCGRKRCARKRCCGRSRRPGPASPCPGRDSGGERNRRHPSGMRRPERRRGGPAAPEEKSAGTASGRDVQGSGYSGTYLPSFPGGKAAFDLSPPPHSAGPEAFPPGFPRRQFQPPSGAFAALYPAPSAPDGSGLRRAGSSGDDQRQRFRLPRPHRQRRSRFDPFGDRGRISAPRPPYRKPL